MKLRLMAWNSMENSMEFHRIQWHGIPWNFVNSRNLMEFGFDRVDMSKVIKSSAFEGTREENEMT
jgi:hypothetical protein